MGIILHQKYSKTGIASNPPNSEPYCRCSIHSCWLEHLFAHFSIALEWCQEHRILAEGVISILDWFTFNNPWFFLSLTEIRPQRLQHAALWKGTQLKLQQEERYRTIEHKSDCWLWELISPISDDYAVQVEKLLQTESRLRFTYVLACFLSPWQLIHLGSNPGIPYWNYHQMHLATLSVKQMGVQQ